MTRFVYLPIPAMSPSDTVEARTITITLRLQLPLYDRVLAAAKADRRSFNSMASLLLEEALDRRD
jgi:hypothetical protein